MDADEALARAWLSQIDEEFAAALVTPVAPIRSSGRRHRRAGGGRESAEALLVSPLADLFVFPSRLRVGAAEAVWGAARNSASSSFLYGGLAGSAGGAAAP